MKNRNCSLIIIILLLIVLHISPTYALDSRELLFREALNFSSEGQFDNALDKWNDYLDSYPDDPAALSNRGNVKLVVCDPKDQLLIKIGLLN